MRKFEQSNAVVYDEVLFQHCVLLHNIHLVILFVACGRGRLRSIFSSSKICGKTTKFVSEDYRTTQLGGSVEKQALNRTTIKKEWILYVW